MRFGPRALAQTTARLGQTQRKGALEGEGGELNLKRSLGALEREKKRKRKRERKKEREREKKKKEKERERERQRNRKRKRKRKRERDKERKRERERSKGPRTVLQTIVVHCFETSAPRLCRTLLVRIHNAGVLYFRSAPSQVLRGVPAVRRSFLCDSGVGVFDTPPHRRRRLLVCQTHQQVSVRG